MTSEPIIHLNDVRVTAEGKEILAVDHLSVEPGERVALIGPSGAGKTTLLRLIKGFVEPTQGTVEVLERSLPIQDRLRLRNHHRRIGMIQQHFDLIGSESVWNNVIHGRLGHNPLWRTIFSRYSEADREFCLQALREVRMEEKIGRATRTLSGGEKQRVAIARALTQEPKIILADEPVSSLDPGLARAVIELLMEVCDVHGLTLLMSLHLPDLAREFCQRMIAIREGRILWDQEAEAVDDAQIEEVYRQPRTKRVSDVEFARSSSPSVFWTLGRLDQPVHCD